ncbi:hypothetical protein [Sulfobacillus harzensis]|uniref:Uncharacterized protein n=1 Tax=Sulfobacillus harzensis TaxID=2729629 RepID=A0A7Y0L220_9FIRM|nr:hypothetical protein [Sulfobacillus harzensis]NMP21869.1 hypothetical protein [Sulfobacillus harzensis]
MAELHPLMAHMLAPFTQTTSRDVAVAAYQTALEPDYSPTRECPQCGDTITQGVVLAPELARYFASLQRYPSALWCDTDCLQMWLEAEIDDLVKWMCDARVVGSDVEVVS